MQSPNISWVSFLIIIKFAIGSSDSDGELYWKCSNTFSCGGNITGIGYPFRGAGDPEHCGYPGLVLSCDDRSNVTNIDIVDLKYRVLELDESSQKMRIAREDTMDSACPTVMANTTLDYTVFDYAASCMNYTFLYGCHFNPGFLTPVYCGGDGGGAYVMPGAMGPMDCDASVVVSGAVMAVNEHIDTAELGEALEHGFQIRWKMESKSCSDCTASQGRCGYDLATNKTVCYCRDPPYVSESDACAVADYGSPPKSKGTYFTSLQ